MNYSEVFKKSPSNYQPVFDMYYSSFATTCVYIANDLNIFNQIGRGLDIPEQLARELNLSQPVLIAVCQVLVAYGNLEYEDNKLKLPEYIKTYFCSDSPFYSGRSTIRISESMEYKKIKNGLEEGWAPIGSEGKSYTEMWEQGTISQQAAEKFTEMMHQSIISSAVYFGKNPIFNQMKHVVDAGGGSGVSCMAINENNPNTKTTVFDLPPVCNETKKYVNKYGFDGKVDTYPGNFFQDDWPKDFDGIFFCNILHDWPISQVKLILDRAYENLNPGGKILVQEALLDECKMAPKSTTVFNLLMCLNHRSQQFTSSELEELLCDSGFSNFKAVDYFSPYSLVVAEK